MTASFSPHQIQEATGGRWIGAVAKTDLQGVFTDSRVPRAGGLFIPLRGPNFDGHAFLERAAREGAAAVLAEERYLAEYPAEARALPVPVLAVSDTLFALGELARAYRASLSPRTIAITGSVGKTTVKNLIASVAEQYYDVHASRKNYNNLIGLPLEILQMSYTAEILIVECGADRPGEVSRLTEIAQPHIGVVTHIVPCHLERFGTLQRVAEEKGKLLAGLQEPAPCAVVNAAVPERETLLAACKAPVRFYGRQAESVVWAEDEALGDDGTPSFWVCDAHHRFPVQLQVVGAHQIENALAAALVGRLLDIPPDEIKTGLEAYSGCWGRMQRVQLPDGTVLIEDVYNSNPASMEAALDFLARSSRRPRVGVFGEMWDLGEASEHWHLHVGRQISGGCLETLLAVGPKAKGFADGATQAARPPAEIHHFETTGEALQWLRTNRKPGGLLLVKGSRGMQMETISEGLKNG